MKHRSLMLLPRSSRTVFTHGSKMEDLALFGKYIFTTSWSFCTETIEIEVPCDDDPEVKVPVTFPVDDVKVIFLRS